jgi:hypothetical protein
MAPATERMLMSQRVREEVLSRLRQRDAGEGWKDAE